MEKTEKEPKDKVKKTKKKKGFLFIGLVVLVVVIIIFLPVRNITCYETKTITEKEPYQTTEYYYEREPYTVCAGHSFWTGKCNEWKTEYETVRKSRTVTKYRYVDKEIQEPYTKQVNWLFGTCDN